jgi:hypothetical protein
VLRMHDVGGAHTPTTGAFSRFGWNHPGPLLLWFGAVPLRLFGTSGVLAAMAVLNGAWLVGAVAAARRLGGDALAGLVTVGAAVLVHAHGATKLVDPWNPWAAVLPVLCFLCSAAAFAQTGRRWTLAVAALSGSFAAQAHLGTVPIVVAGSVLAGAWFWRSHPPVRRSRWVLAALVLSLGLLWSGPILDQLAGSGNAHSILDFTLHPVESRPAPAASLGAAAHELGWRPAWTGGTEANYIQTVTPAPLWELLLLPIALAAVAATAWRRRNERLLLCAAFDLALVALSTLAITRTVGAIKPYLIRWSWPVAMLATATVLWGMWQARPGRFNRTAVTSSAVIVGVIAISLTSLASVRAVITGPVRPVPRGDRAAAALAAIIEDRLPKASYEPVTVDPADFSAASTGAFAELERKGWNLDYPRSAAFFVGAWRTDRGSRVPRLIIVGRSGRQGWKPPDGARRVGLWDPLPASGRARDRRLSARVLRAAGDDDGRGSPAELTAAVIKLTLARRQRDIPAEMDEIQFDGETYEIWLAPPTN